MTTDADTPIQEEADHTRTYVLDETALTKAMTIEELAHLAASQIDDID
jgi:hypothetical protein